MKKLLGVLLIGVFLPMAFGLSSLFAGEIDLLLSKLVEKGILSAGEAQTIKTETQEQVKKEISQGKYSSLPAWVQTIKMKGDFRLRYQYDHAKALLSATPPAKAQDRYRARIRLRLGLEGKVNDKLKVGVGLATGLNDGSTDASRSTNATLDNSFSKKPISLDYAYAEYSPKPWATLWGGKFKNTIWEPGDLIWDTDINPEGAAAKFTKKFSSSLDGYLMPAIFIIDEGANDGADPILAVVQAGGQYKFNDNINAQFAVSYNDAMSVIGKALDGTVSTNSIVANAATGVLKYDYTWITPALQVNFKEPLKGIGVDLPYFAFFGEYVNNIAAGVSCRNTGYMLGFKFGTEKIENWKDWQFGYNYAMLGKDSVLDILPDSDRYGGRTGMRSHEVKFDFGLGKNTWLGFDGYYGWRLPGSYAYVASGDTRGTQTRPASVVQVDWNMKW